MKTQSISRPARITLGEIADVAWRAASDSCAGIKETRIIAELLFTRLIQALSKSKGSPIKGNAMQFIGRLQSELKPQTVRLALVDIKKNRVE